MRRDRLATTYGFVELVGASPYYSCSGFKNHNRYIALVPLIRYTDLDERKRLLQYRSPTLRYQEAVRSIVHVHANHPAELI